MWFSMLFKLTLLLIILKDAMSWIGETCEQNKDERSNLLFLERSRKETKGLEKKFATSQVPKLGEYISVWS